MSPFTPAQERTLRDVLDAVAPAEVVLIGATAVGLYVPMEWRKTHDLDLVLAIGVAALDQLPERLHGWRRDPRREHVWYSPHGVDVDLVPAGPAERAHGEVTFPRSGNVMDLTAIGLAFEHARQVAIGDRHLGVAPLEVLVILKMSSWLDSPHRQHDLADLAHILESWLPIDDDRRYDDDVIAEQIPYDDVPALLLGRLIAAITKEPHHEIVRRFLAQVGDERHFAHGTMLKYGPSSWRTYEELFDRRLAALQRGLGF